MQVNIKIAGHVFSIETIYDALNELCKDYESGEPTEFFVKITSEDIEKEKEAALKEQKKYNQPVIEMPDTSYEAVAVYRKIVEVLFLFNILLYHGSTIAVDGSAYMFIAKSGTGKSTHTRLWRELLGEKAVMINDDKPLIQISEDSVTVYGTPWSGKHHLNTNTAAPLKGICIVKRGEGNSIREITLEDAYPMLLQQTCRIPGKENTIKTMNLINQMGSHVRFYTMNCNMEIDAARMSYCTMHEGKVQM